MPEVGTAPVDRPRLVDRLAAFTGRLVVLSAPAGYGKSVLAAQWLAADRRPGRRLTLTRADTDPFVLLTHLARALASIEPLSRPDLDALTAADDELGVLLDRLRAVLAARTEPFLLVLDDVHLIAGSESEQVLAPLIGSTPVGSSVALATREAAPLPTSRAALHDEALVLGAADLAMTAAEAGALLRDAGVPADPTVTEMLHEHTEGWPAGLYLAALTLRHAPDPERAARAISGAERRVTDYFAEEVLPALDAEDVEFLLATAGLERCCGDLCDAALGRTGSGAVLERLARTNRFVVPLDEVGDWYRYHHLFAEMLRAEAHRRDARAAAAIASRASQWWEARLEPDPAVTLAFEAGDRPAAIALVSRFAPALQNQRQRSTVGRWLASFTDEEIMASTALAVTAAWNALLDGDVDGVHRYATAAELAAGDTPLPDGTPPHAAVALLRALTTSKGLSDVRDLAHVAFTDHPSGRPYRAVAAALESGARLMLGDLAGAVVPIEEGIAIGRAILEPGRVQCLAARARLAAMGGDWQAADRDVAEALALVEEHSFRERPAMGLVFSIAALVHAGIGSTRRADEERDHTTSLLARLEDVTPFHAACSTLEVAEAALLTGRVDDGIRLLAEAERRVRRLRDTGLLPFALERVGRLGTHATARPAARLIEPLSPAELRVLTYLPTHLSFGDIGDALFVSRNTVKSHAMAIYRKLGVTSRSAAVKEAAALGLVDDPVDVATSTQDHPVGTTTDAVR